PLRTRRNPAQEPMEPRGETAMADAHQDLFTSWRTSTTKERHTLFAQLLLVWGCLGVVAFESWWALDHRRTAPVEWPTHMYAQYAWETQTWQCLTLEQTQRWISDELGREGPADTSAHRSATTVHP